MQLAHCIVARRGNSDPEFWISDGIGFSHDESDQIWIGFGSGERVRLAYRREVVLRIPLRPETCGPCNLWKPFAIHFVFVPRLKLQRNPRPLDVDDTRPAGDGLT
jgi:hypothetical protein